MMPVVIAIRKINMKGNMNNEPWYKASYEIELTTLNGVSIATRGLLSYLCALTDDSLGTIQTTKKNLEKKLHVGSVVLNNALDALQERGLIKHRLINGRSKMEIEFCFGDDSTTVTDIN